jgi:uncharacterized membrane protein
MLLPTWLIVVFAVAMLDGIWISSNMNMYSALYTRVQCGKPMRVKMDGAILAYIFLVIVLIVFVPPLVRNTDKSLLASFKTAGLLGGCIYGIYNFTNLATLSGYSLKAAMIDTLWGTTLFTIVGWLIANYSN